MKKRLIILSALLLISIMVAGGTMAWFTSSPEAEASNFKIGIVQVEVSENGFEDISVRNLGTIDSYIRVKVIPQWSEPDLSIANVGFDINDSDWKYEDGYYYYKYAVKGSEETSKLINTISFDLTEEYEDASFTIQVVAEGVQSTHEAWKDIWSIYSLPF